MLVDQSQKGKPINTGSPDNERTDTKKNEKLEQGNISNYLQSIRNEDLEPEKTQQQPASSSADMPKRNTNHQLDPQPMCQKRNNNQQLDHQQICPKRNKNQQPDHHQIPSKRNNNQQPDPQQIL